MKESRPASKIMDELWEAHQAVLYLEKVARGLPKKLYTKRKSHKRANFIAKKTGRARLSKHTRFTLMLMTAQMRFNNLQEEWQDSQRNFTMKDALAK
jgi:hypothetical protein